MVVRSVPVNKKYTMDKLFLNAGNVMRLPQYHADLNPIELVWGDIKGKVDKCLSHLMEKKKQLCSNFFLNIQSRSRENAVSMNIALKLRKTTR